MRLCMLMSTAVVPLVCILIVAFVQSNMLMPGFACRTCM